MKKLVILGGAETGVGAAVLASKKGYDVFVSDNGPIREDYKNVLLNNGIKFEEGGHTARHYLAAGEVIKSPGIPDTAPLIHEITAAGIPIISDIEFAGRYTSAKRICITGSNGKTTTALLIYHIFRKAGLKVGLAGNVGKSFAMQVAENDFDIYVLEISSFQLDYMFEFRADVAVITNITPDHLDRYESFDAYAASKFRMLNNQREQDFFVYCHDDKVTRSEIAKRKINGRMIPFSLNEKPQGDAGYLSENKLKINIKTKPINMTIENLALQGRHNLYNSMAAGIVARVFDIRKDIIKESLAEFQGVEHRMELVTKVHGIEFINDSKATNVNSTWFALESMDAPIIWISGGVDKGNDYSALIPLVREKVKAIICLGMDNSKIKKEFKGLVETINETTSMDDAVRFAYSIGKPGDTVLLSPACASFDLFKNFEERGNQFKKSVFDL